MLTLAADWRAGQSRSVRTTLPLCLGFLMGCANFCAAGAAFGSANDVAVASHKLGFSGATVSVREDFRGSKWPISKRTFLLVGVTGRRVTFPLQQGGGLAGNDSLDLFVKGAGQADQFFLVSEKDCVAFDPVMLKVSNCLKRPPCDGGHVSGLTYLGRFDWMNGRDPPNGAVEVAFRFGPFEDAAEGGSCPFGPQKPQPPRTR